MKRFVSISGILIVLLGVFFAAHGIWSANEKKLDQIDCDMFMRLIKDGHYQIKELDPDTMPLFSVSGLPLEVNGETVIVYEFKTNAEAEYRTNNIEGDGYHVGKAWVSWMDTPHFYQRGRLIVLYVGNTGPILNDLKNIMGTQVNG